MELTLSKLLITKVIRKENVFVFLISLSKLFSNFLDDDSLLIDGPIKCLGIKAKQTYHTMVLFRHLKFKSYLTQWDHQTSSKAFANVCVFLQLDENQSHVDTNGGNSRSQCVLGGAHSAILLDSFMC